MTVTRTSLFITLDLRQAWHPSTLACGSMCCVPLRAVCAPLAQRWNIHVCAKDTGALPLLEGNNMHLLLLVLQRRTTVTLNVVLPYHPRTPM